MSKWFLYSNEQISGPYSHEELQKLSEHNDLSAHHLWSKSLNEWKTYSWWKNNQGSLHTDSIKQVSKLKTWHYALNGKSFGPFSRKEIVNELQVHNQFKKILIWTEGLSSWVPFYEFTDLMNEVGVSRRKYPRVSINGNLEVHLGNNLVTVGQLKMLSEGGCGAEGITSLHNNQKVKLKISSPAFQTHFLVDAEVRYTRDSGEVGFKFIQLHTEARSTILTYINSQGKEKAS